MKAEFSRVLIKKQTLNTIFMLAICILISSCGGGSSSSSSKPPSPSYTSTAVTIDTAGVIPIIGNSATNTIIYVHNNTNTTIHNISYTATNNNNTGSQATLLSQILTQMGVWQNTRASIINTDSATICSSIPANGSCPLSIKTPTPSSKLFQGSSIITANYVDAKNNPQSFSRVINYATVTTTQNGVIVNSGISMVGVAGVPSYGMVYLYGSGANQVYTIKSMDINKPSVVISNGNIVGQSMSSGSIQAVEVMVPVFTDGGINAILSITTTQGFTSSNHLGILATPTPASAILVSGLAPIVNSESPNFVIPINNAGNASATSLTITYPTGVSAGPTVSNQCTTTISPYASCNLSFTVTSAAASGSGIVTVNYNYTGGSNSVSQNVIWYNAGGPLASYSSSVNPLSFDASVGESSVITITNIGTLPLTGLSLAAPKIISGSATASNLSPGDTCTGTTLAPNTSCSYSIEINASVATSGYVALAFTASWNNGTTQTYTRAFVIPYTAAAYAPLLIVTVPTLQIVGDNIQTQTVNVTVANNGNAPATLTIESLSGNPSYITTAGSCSSPLAASATCSTSITVTLGPTINSGTTNITPSGVSYNVTYYGGTITSGSPSTASGTVNATVTPDSQNLVLESVAVTQSTSGNGESLGTPIIFSGYNTNAQYITLTYQNQGTASINISGTINNNSGWAYNINTATSTCYNSGSLPSASVAPNGRCTIVFTNVLGTNFLGLGSGLGASYTMNLTVPTIVFYDSAGSQFQIQPPLLTPFTDSTTLYVTAQQATLTSTLTQAGVGGNVTVTNTLANATGYPNSFLTVITNMEDYFASGSPISNSSNCTVNNTTYAGVMTQTCTLGPSTLTGNAVYAVNSAYESGSPIYESYPLNATFTVSTTGGQIVSVSQFSSQLNPLQ